MALVSLMSLFVIAFSVSLDGFGVGLSYGARGIRIPLASLLVVAGCSGLLLSASMWFGDWLALHLAPQTATATGAAILVAIGLWAVIQFFVSRKADSSDDPQSAPVRTQEASGMEGERTVVRFELRKLGLVVHILRKPSAADVDRSGTISAAEAALLGVALSLDAVGAGIGAALVGYRAISTALCISVASGVFVRLGTWLGRRMNGRLGRRLAILPGFLLIGIGILKWLQL